MAVMMKKKPYEISPEVREVMENVVPLVAKHCFRGLKVLFCALMVVCLAFPLTVPAEDKAPAKVENAVAPGKKSEQALSPAEAQWLKTHDTLRVGFFDNYMPYNLG